MEVACMQHGGLYFMKRRVIYFQTWKDKKGGRKMKITKKKNNDYTDLLKDLENAFKLGNTMAQKKSFTKEDSRKLLYKVRHGSSY